MFIYRIPAHMSGKIYWRRLWLYTVGDLRAQGLLQHKRSWYLVFYLICLGLSLTTVCRLTWSYVTHPLGEAPTLLAVLTLSTLLFLIYNALSVGILSGTSGKAELRALSYLPVTTGDIIKMRMFLSVLRAEVITLIFFLPCCLTAALHAHFSARSFLLALAMVVIFPLVPAAIGAWLNLRESKPSLIVWLQLILGCTTVGGYLALQYPVAPPTFRLLVLLGSLPARGLLLLAPPLEMVIFLLAWLAIAALLFQWIGYAAQQRNQVPLQPFIPWVRLSLQFPNSWHQKGTIALAGLALKRMTCTITFVCLVMFLTATYITIHVVQTLPVATSHLTVSIEAVVLLSVSSFLFVPYTGLLLTTALGDAQEHRSLCHFPLSPTRQTGAVYLVAFLMVVVLTSVGTMIVASLSQSVLSFWFGLDMVTSSIGGGMLLFASLLERRSLFRCLLWGASVFPYLVLKLFVSVFGLVLLPAHPLLGVWLAGSVVDGSIAGVMWLWFIKARYVHFVENI